MTTTVIIKTHGWPVQITTTDDYTDPTGRQTVTKVRERMERWQERSLCITDTRRLEFDELTSEGWEANPADPIPPAVPVVKGDEADPEPKAWDDTPSKPTMSGGGGPD